MNSSCPIVKLILAVAFSIGGVFHICHAQVDFHWADANGGNFNDPGNWSSFFPGAIPDVFVRTVFDLADSFTVTFPRDEITNANSVHDGIVVFDLGSNTYTHGSLFVGEQTGDVAELTLINGTVDAGPTKIGEAGSTFGALIVDDSATLNANSVRVGQHGAGQLLIRNGGAVSTAIVLAGNQLTGSGTIEVAGGSTATRSRLTSSGAITIGQHNQGVMRITNGGLVESNPSSSGDPDEIGLFPAPGNEGGLGAVGQVFVEGTADDGTPSAWISTGPLQMGNIAGTSYAQGMMTITAGGQVQHTEAHLSSASAAPNRVEIRGTDATNNPSKWTLTSGQLDLIGELEVTDGGGLHIERGVVLGWADDSLGRLTIDGSNANGVRSSYTGGGITVGSDGNGELYVTGGGLFTAPGLPGSMTLGSKSTGFGEVVISGKDAFGNSSTMELGRTLHLGNEGSASLMINGGGVLRSGFDDPLSVGLVAIRDTADPVEITITDVGSSWEHANNLFLGGTAAANGGFATMTVDNQATVDIGGTLKVWSNNELQIHRGTLAAGMLELAAGSDLQFGIGGTQPVVDFGQILVDDDAFLDGNLEIALLDGFEPSTADTFVVLDAFNLVSEVFENVPPGGRVFTEDFSGSFRVDYGAGSPFDPSQIVLSEFTINTLTADVDGDLDVDSMDLTIVQRTNPALIADWEAQYSSAPSLAASQAVAIPEPSTWVILLLGAAASLRRTVMRRILLACHSLLVVLALLVASPVDAASIFNYTFNTNVIGAAGGHANAEFRYLGQFDPDGPITKDELIDGYVEFWLDSGLSTSGDLANDDGIFGNLPRQLDGAIDWNVISDRSGVAATIGPPGGRLGASGGTIGANPFTGSVFFGQWFLDVHDASDFDFDGDIDGADFLGIQLNLSTLIPEWEAGYAVDLSTVNSADYSSAQTIPEPSTWVFLHHAALALLFLPAKRHNNSRRAIQ